MPHSERNVTPVVRAGSADDLDFIAWVDREDEGSGSSYSDGWTPERWTERRREMLGFLLDVDKFAFVVDDQVGQRPVGAIFGRFVDIKGDLPPWSIFRMLPPALFPDDGRVCEVFALWVDPAFRRRGLATCLKREAEGEAIRRGVGVIYTSTNCVNEHVIALNMKLGYREVRRGPIWDDVIRVSLLKTLPASPAEA